MNTKSSIFTNGEATSENTTLVFMSEIKIDVPLKKSKSLFLLYFRIAIFQFIQVRQPSGQEYNFFLAVLHPS